ncbi:unnamed protein product [Urochloa humidicola]
MEVTKPVAARLWSLCILPGARARLPPPRPAQRAKAGCAKARARRPCWSPQEQIAASRLRLLARRAGTRRCGWERGRRAPAPHARRKLRRCLAWAPHARPGHHRRPDLEHKQIWRHSHNLLCCTPAPALCPLLRPAVWTSCASTVRFAGQPPPPLELLPRRDGGLSIRPWKAKSHRARAAAAGALPLPFNLPPPVASPAKEQAAQVP